MIDVDADAIGQVLLARRAWLAVAESCTGGLLAARLTDVPGASAWFDRGLVTYSNRAKQDLLAVPEALLAAHGAVSGPVAEAMASGLRRRADVDWTVAVTGIAGPGGGTPEKPVGTVWIAWAGPGGVTAQRHQFAGDRAAIRQQTVNISLQGLRARITVK